MTRELVGTILVDAGIVMVGDPCYTLPDDGTFRDATARNWDTFARSVYPPGQGANPNPTPLGAGVSVVVQSGYGDGEYPVYVERTKGGSVKSLTVEFITEYDEAGGF